MEPQGPVVCDEAIEVLFRASSYGVFLMPDGTHRSHYGIDLFAPQGTEVRSPVMGIVDRVGLASNPREAGGNCVRIKDTTNEYHYAAHMMTAPLVRRGDPVDIGSPLGWLGRTGSARHTSAHTHYEWRDRLGRPKNPFGALVRAHGLEPNTRVVRGAFRCPGGGISCESLVGDASSWCQEAHVALLEAPKVEDPAEQPEWPPSMSGNRPVRWDIIAGVGAAAALMFAATTGGWFVRRRSA